MHDANLERNRGHAARRLEPQEIRIGRLKHERVKVPRDEKEVFIQIVLIISWLIIQPANVDVAKIEDTGEIFEMQANEEYSYLEEVQISTISKTLISRNYGALPVHFQRYQFHKSLNEPE